ncbi:hypothetical protein IX332_000484 [Porphyromonas levii]|nr:hypothetical protein [Porphyromonas levii]MBR8715521.1 hypothetical protein [Porphyromonas levii]MBR8728046.1 hypothetical protein [Porphyromonas levii]MBR8729173.1 hypothetical protein [Porphyromonas levii]MBR8735401.1 hypothetical protein [Porphyromonas levii]
MSLLLIEQETLNSNSVQAEKTVHKKAIVFLFIDTNFID